MKQCDAIELLTKVDCCQSRCTSEADFSFFENVDTAKDIVPFENASLLPFAIEWGYALINLQQPLRKPGTKSGLHLGYWN